VFGWLLGWCPAGCSGLVLHSRRRRQQQPSSRSRPAAGSNKKEVGEPGGRRASTSPAAGDGINNCGRWDGSGGGIRWPVRESSGWICFAGLEELGLGGKRQEGMLPVS